VNNTCSLLKTHDHTHNGFLQVSLGSGLCNLIGMLNLVDEGGNLCWDDIVVCLDW
jgi:hypothetical protein